MTVKELIEELKKYDEGMQVHIMMESDELDNPTPQIIYVTYKNGIKKWVMDWSMSKDCIECIGL